MRGSLSISPRSWQVGKMGLGKVSISSRYGIVYPGMIKMTQSLNFLT